MNHRRTMSPEQWERVQQILHDALEHEDAERDAFVEEACGDDRDLRSELAVSVERVLRREINRETPIVGHAHVS